MVFSKSFASLRQRPSPGEGSLDERLYDVAKDQLFGSVIWARWGRGWWDPEDEIDLAIVDFDPAHDGANDFPHTESVEMIEAFAHFGREVFEVTDHESEVTLGFDGFESCLMPTLQLGQALFQACDTRLELCFVDDPLSKTVDEPTNSASQTIHLPVEADDLFGQGGALTGLGHQRARHHGGLTQVHAVEVGLLSD